MPREYHTLMTRSPPRPCRQCRARCPGGGHCCQSALPSCVEQQGEAAYLYELPVPGRQLETGRSRSVTNGPATRNRQGLYAIRNTGPRCCTSSGRRVSRRRSYRSSAGSRLVIVPSIATEPSGAVHSPLAPGSSVQSASGSQAWPRPSTVRIAIAASQRRSAWLSSRLCIRRASSCKNSSRFHGGSTRQRSRTRLSSSSVNFSIAYGLLHRDDPRQRIGSAAR